MARYAVCIILCLTYSAASPGWQNETQVKRPGEAIVLNCEADFPLHWCYPRVYEDDCVNQESTGNVELSYTSTNKYKGKLMIRNVTYADTGYYVCVSNETTECNIRMEGAQRKYVYVKDSNNLLAGSDFCHIHGELRGNAVLPCRPTSPEIKITLLKDGNNVRLMKEEGVDQRIAYDPTIGFTLKKIGISDSGTYMCQVDSKTNLIATMILQVKERKPTYAMKPTITGPQHRIVRKGKNLDLECKGLAEKGITFQVMWFKSNRQQGGTPQTSCNENDYSCIIATLRISNVTESDGGTYTCVITDQYKNTDNDTRTVTVIGEGELGISLKSDSSEIIDIQAGKTKEVKIVVNVFAPENVTLNWYGPQGNQLYPDGRKYDINSTYDQTVLKVFDVTVCDAGVYRLDANNSVGKESLNRQVNVQGKPNVSVSHDLRLFLMNSEVNFSCVVCSPKPIEVTFLFKECDLRKPDDCDGENDIKQKFSESVAQDVFNFTLRVRQGILRCVANNSFGDGNDVIKVYVTDHPKVSQSPHLWGEPENVVLEEDGVFSVVEGDNFTLKCASSVYNNSQHPLWYTQNGTVHSSIGLAVTYNKTEFLYMSNLEFSNVTKQQHNATYVCYENNNTAIPLGKPISVSDAQNAKITETNLKNMEVSLGDNVHLTCMSTGKPDPETLWYKDGDLVVNDTTVELTERNQSLKIAPVKPENEGKYSCVVKNRLHKESARGYVTIADKDDLTPVMTGIIVVCLFGFVVMIVVLIVKVQKQKMEKKDLKTYLKISTNVKLKEELNLMGLANFEMGALESINPELPVDEQADLLPYDRTWEFPREKLVLGRQLGSGAFGVVMKAEAYGILDNEEKTIVAVKMVKSGVDRSFIKTLASELKIMIHLGKHLNVVNLLGASTKSLAKMELMVIVEYCRYGNLHNYLLRHRDDFIDQLDRTTGKLNLALGVEKFSRSQSSMKKTNLKHRFLSSASSVEGVSYYGDSSLDLCAPSTSNAIEVSRLASEMTVMSYPAGEPDECLLSSGSSEQPNWRVKYGSDYKGTTMPVCSQDLLCWAFQVARGMEYLASHKDVEMNYEVLGGAVRDGYNLPAGRVLHGDLAARNILLADDNVVKICDFGLAKSMYKSDNYQRKSASPLPVKWMALESIRDRVFSTQSDVWSFGIVLWELFSLAQTPYPGMEAGERLFQKLVNGYRMDKPPYATSAIYGTMLQCWNANPLERLSFTELAEQLGDMLDDNIRRHYEELNSPYMNMNEQNRHTDYLNMMSAPNYSNFTAHQEAQHEHDNSPVSCPEQNTRHFNMRSLTGVVSPLSADSSVFQFSHDTNNSCYLNMTGKEVIFSPGHVSEKPFKYFPHLRKQQAADVQHPNELNLHQFRQSC